MNSARSASVALSATAVVSCIGSTLPTIRDRLRSGHGGMDKNHSFADRVPAPLGQIPTQWMEEAIALGGATHSMTRLQSVALRLITELWDKARLTPRYLPHEIGLSISTTSAGLERWLGRLTALTATGAEWSRQNPRLWFGPEDHGGTLADFLLSKFPIRGPDLTFSTACSGGALAIARGVDMIRRGDVKACIVGGIDILTSMTVHGFNSLQVMDHDLCKPFHPERKGMNLAEGGAFFVLDKSPINQPLGFVDGYGVATDYYHMTQPHPSGAPMALSMQRALMHAGWDASSVSYVNAHGTGTKANDSSEATAIASVFADSIYYNSTKALHGHTLAAAGALEAAITADGLVSGTFFVDERLSQQSKIPTFDGTNTPRRALSNSFGFGGHNVTLALSYPGGAG